MDKCDNHAVHDINDQHKSINALYAIKVSREIRGGASHRNSKVWAEIGNHGNNHALDIFFITKPIGVWNCPRTVTFLKYDSGTLRASWLN
jgi:hypothetical protein